MNYGDNTQEKIQSHTSKSALKPCTYIINLAMGVRYM